MHDDTRSFVFMAVCFCLLVLVGGKVVSHHLTPVFNQLNKAVNVCK